MGTVSVFTLLILNILLIPKTVRSTESHFPPLDNVKATASPEEQAAAVEGLIFRLLGAHRAFNITVDPNIGVPNKDTFIIKNDGRKGIHITGTTGVAAAWAFQHYLKYYCGCHISWSGNQLSIPSPLPRVNIAVVITSNDRFRYYQNVCTVSYSMVWWKWPRWEREIDWMAMNAINLPLAFTGQEAIFQKVYLKLGFTNADLESFFTGPAFLAWGRMGNIEGFGGPLHQSWIDGHLALQHKILTRMRSFGMTPVLPAFAGHVPAATSRLFPNANVSRLGNWSKFNSTYSSTYLLDFSDPLFKTIGSAVIQEMMKEFNGTDHVYSADTFNEMTPNSSELSYLASAGKAVYGAMATADPKAVWLMQGWMFTKPFWKPLQAKALLTSVAKSPFKARQFPKSTMVGTGLTPEGIDQNDVIYEFMNENAWRKVPRDILDWIVGYAARRYGQKYQYTEMAWYWLTITVYNCTTGLPFHGKNGFVRRPSLKMKSSVWYDPGDIDKAWIRMINSLKQLSSKPIFMHDFMDISRQGLQLISIKYHKYIVDAYHNKNITALRLAGSKYLGVLDDLDMLLASDPHFLLGTWLEAAKSWANTSAERILYEYNARNQITLWGPTGELRDYAAKEWAGLTGKFYKKRWSLFVDHLTKALTSGKEFNQTAFNEECFLTVEKPFTFDRSVFPTTPTGDSFTIGVELYMKYHPFIPPTSYEVLQHTSRRKHKLNQIKTRLNIGNPVKVMIEE